MSVKGAKVMVIVSCDWSPVAAIQILVIMLQDILQKHYSYYDSCLISYWFITICT